MIWRYAWVDGSGRMTGLKKLSSCMLCSICTWFALEDPSGYSLKWEVSLGIHSMVKLTISNNHWKCGITRHCTLVQKIGASEQSEGTGWHIEWRMSAHPQWNAQGLWLNLSENKISKRRILMIRFQDVNHFCFDWEIRSIKDQPILPNVHSATNNPS